jgi:phospholipase C
MSLMPSCSGKYGTGMTVTARCTPPRGANIQMIRDDARLIVTAIIIACDENGGRWDHVAPPVIDRWGPGTRVPTIIISPYAKKGFVDHTQYDTTSILKFIESRWGLKPLGTRDANANNLLNAFDFSQ